MQFIITLNFIWFNIIQIKSLYWMHITLDQIIICQSRYDNKTIYFRVQSEDVFVSSAAQLSLTEQLKCEPNLAISQKLPLKVQIWNYEPHKLLSQWRFQSREVATMKNKHMISDHNWIIYLKKSDKNIYNKQNKMLRSNKSRQTERLQSRFKMKVNDSKIKANKMKREQINLALESKGKGNKDSIKNTLKNTIRYLIKQQSSINNFEHYGMEELSSKAKTGKCTPASQQISNIRGCSAIFSQYGLNLTQLNNQQTQTEPFSLKLQLKKKIGRTQ